jgi:CHAD domain-containing protein
LRQGLAAPRFRLLLLDLAANAAAPEWADSAPAQPLRDYAAGMLEKRWRRLVEAGEAIDSHGAEELHAMRLDAKRLRYAAELFAPLWSAKAGRRFLRRLAELQEALGLANDTTVARALVASLATREPGRAWAIGLAEGWALARGRRAASAARAAWSEARKAEPFWN